jgi:hypothetical protein
MRISNKIITIKTLGVVSSVVIFTTLIMSAAANAVTGCPTGTDSSSQLCSDAGGGDKFQETIVNVTEIIMYIVGAMSIITIIIGGIKYAVAGGDEQKMTTARRMIIYSLVGLAVAILAWTITNFVFDQVGRAR